jgi:cytochrome c-type biogenesis protein
VNTLLYPFTLGMMAAVNPCGFPLLPAYLELFVGGPVGAAAPRASRALKAVTAAAYATVGFVILFGTLGLVTQLGWSALADHSANAARYVMVAVGAGMVVVGLITLARRNLKLPLPTIGSGAGLRRPAAVAVFGFSYGVASIGCALPLFIGGVAASFGHQSTLRGAADLLAYALGMGTVLGALAVGIALVGRGAGRHLRRASRWVPVAGGLILVAVGTYLTWYWVTDIASPGSSFAVQRFVERVQLDISNPINAHARLVGGLLGAAVVAAVVAGGLSRPAPAQPTTAPDQPAPSVREPEPSRT